MLDTFDNALNLDEAALDTIVKLETGEVNVTEFILELLAQGIHVKDLASVGSKLVLTLTKEIDGEMKSSSIETEYLVIRSN